MEIILFFIFVGYLFLFLRTQEKERYDKKSYKFIKNLFKPKKPSKTPYLDYLLGDTNKFPKSTDNEKAGSNNYDYQHFQNQKLQYFKTPQWNTIRKQVLKRDNYKCVLCSNRIPYAILDVHHITYDKLFNEPLDHLITLCQKCHTKIHEDLGYPSKDIQILKKQYFWSLTLTDQQQQEFKG